MKVLHTPVNYGSLPSHTVRCLREKGIDARGLIFSKTIMQSFDGMDAIYDTGSLPRRIINRIRWVVRFIVCLLTFRPDIIHWYFGKHALPFGLDLWLVKRLNIPRLVEWQGSDIRIPEFEMAENPYYAAAFDNGYEYRHVESTDNSRQRQQRFADAGFVSAAPVGMLQYVQPDIFPQTITLPQRMIVADYTPVFPSLTTTRPLIVHSPTAPVAKGTEAVLKAVEQLRATHEFDFQLIHRLPRDQALALMARADIFLDQFVWGDRGMAALEAMALGKPVVCWIKPRLVPLYPDDSPIINASADTLVETLADLIENPTQRHDLGRRGRAYVERHYAIDPIVTELVSIYTQVIAQFHSPNADGDA